MISELSEFWYGALLMETHKWMRTKIDNSVVVLGKKLGGIFELSGVRLTSYRAVVVGDMGEAEGPVASIIAQLSTTCCFIIGDK